MVSVRKASSDLSEWESLLPSLSNGQLEISSVDITEVEPIVEDYPYVDQKILKAKFYYTITNPFDESISRKYSGDLIYRGGSNILIVDTGSDTPSSSEIIHKLEQELPEKVKIYPGLYPTKQAIWDFIKEADRILKIEVLFQNELYEYDEIDAVDSSDIIGNYIVERADLVFEHDEQEEIVTYADDSLHIHSEPSDSQTITDQIEHVIQIFEREVVYKE